MPRMPNIATILKSEITRVARKEIRTELESLRKTVQVQRTHLASARREIADLAKEQKGLLKLVENLAKAAYGRPGMVAAGLPSPKSDGEGGTPRRFSAGRLAAHRAKLGLSAADYAKLAGVSSPTLTKWETGASRPNQEQLDRLVAVRLLTPAQAKEKLAA